MAGYRAHGVSSRHVNLTTAVGSVISLRFLCRGLFGPNEHAKIHISRTFRRENLSRMKRRHVELVNVRACRNYYHQKDSTRDIFSQRSLVCFEKKFALGAHQVRSLDSMLSCINNMRPLPPDVAMSLGLEIAALTGFTSNKFERVGLPFSETEAIIKGMHCLPNSEIRQFFEVRSHAKPLALVVDKLRNGKNHTNITSDDFREIHAALMAEDSNSNPGQYRGRLAFISSKSTHVLALPTETTALVDRVFGDVNIATEHPVEFSPTHGPYADGNGHTIRLICSLLPLASGYPGFAFFKTDEKKYLESIRKWKEDPSEFEGM